MEVSQTVQQRISTAIAQFRNQMRTSNQRYISRLVAEANTVPAPQRRRKFAQAIQFSGSLPSQYNTPEEVIADPTPAVQWIIEHDGTWPVKPRAEVEDYLRRLTVTINEHFNPDGERDDMEVPEEYRALLKECDGVWDINFRKKGVAGIHGTNCLNPDGVQCKADLFSLRARLYSAEIGRCAAPRAL
jgi:hypothetical protein